MGNLVATGFSMLMLNIASILIVRLLGVDGRGMVASAVILPTAISYGTWFGLPVATAYLAKHSGQERNLVIGTSRTLAAIISIVQLVVTAAIIFFAHESHEVRLASFVFLLFLPINIFQTMHQAIMQADLKIAAVNRIRLAGTSAYVGFLGLLYIAHIESVFWVTVAQLVGAGVWTALYWRSASSRPLFAFDRTESKHLLSYGTKAQIGSTSPLETLRLDQLILALFLTSHDLGLYVIAMTFITANRLIGISIGNIAFPIAIESKMDGKGFTFQIRLLIATATFLATIVAMVEIIMGGFLLNVFFGSASKEALGALQILAIASIFLNARQVVSDVLRGLGLPTIPTQSEIISALTLISVAYLLWDRGLKGVALAVLCSSVLSGAASVLLFVRKTRSSPTTRSSTLADKLPRVSWAWPTVAGVAALSAISGALVARSSFYVICAVLALVLGSIVLLVVTSLRGTRGISSTLLLLGMSSLAWNGIRVTSFMALSDVFLFVAACIVLPGLFASREAGDRLNSILPILLGVSLILSGGAAGSAFAGDLVTSLGPLLRFAIAATLIPALFSLWSPGTRLIKLTIVGWTFSVVASSIYGILGPRDYFGRIEGLTLHPNHLALTCVLAIGPVIAWFFRSRGIHKLIPIFSGTVMAYATILSGSRAGLLGLLAALLITLTLLGRTKMLFLAIVLCVIALLAVQRESTILPTDGGLGRILNSQSTSVTGSDEERRQKLGEALDQIRDQPIVGQGFAHALDAHNVYLQVWGIGGVIAFFGFILVLRRVVYLPISLRYRNPEIIQYEMPQLMMGLLGSFLGFLVAEVFQNALWERFFWVTPSLIAVLFGSIVKNMSVAETTQSSKPDPQGAMPRHVPAARSMALN